MFVTFRKSVLSILVSVCLVGTANHLSASETEKDLADSFCSLEFINARARQNQHHVLVKQFFHKMKIGDLPDGRPKQGTYSDETLKRILDGFDLIQADFGSPTRSLIISNQEKIYQACAREFNTRLQNEDERNFFMSPEVMDWAKRNSAFLVKTLPLRPILNIVTGLSPDKFKPVALTPSEVKELELVSGGMIFVQVLHHFMEALNSDSLKPLITPRFNVVALRKEAAGLRTDAKRIFGDPAPIKFHYTIKMSLRAGERVFERKLKAALKPRKATALNEMKNLAARASYAANPYLTGVCDGIKRRLDHNSITKSAGNWEMVKSTDGAPIAPSSDDMLYLSKAYSRGCYVEKDTFIARNVLEQWANAHHDVGKKAAASHCTLAEWYRFGIGGPRDEAIAVRWEERYTRETGGDDCSRFTRNLLIDPADPWRIVQ